ncbi:MAG: hypothetical protein EA369_04350 [Bradymonadales bacterium]|nr:MAG: hypothetical protein EA369_04350 [Bradymonadales bacterium]
MEVSWRELRESLLWEVEKSATRIEIEPTPSFEWVFLGVDRQDPSDLDLFKKILKAVGLSVEGDSRWCAEPALQLPKELASQMRQKSSWKLLCFGDYQGEKSLGQEGRILIVAPSLKSLASSPTEKKKLWQKLQACL